MWQGSVHEERNLACVNCHTIMKSVSRKNQLKTVWEPDTCFQCHKDRRAQMYRSSHMPMREGKVVCSDCHNPHGSFTEALLKKDSVNDVCYTCHAEKRGPFLWEHAPVRENCDNCHDPHGTVQQYSLKMARPRLCNECHNLMASNDALLNGTRGGPGNNHTLGQACENCHTAIHGSNAPNGQLLFR
jgi:DmsE family decaheme c-type cytochrome